MAAAGLGDDLLLANEIARPAPPRRHGRAAATRPGSRSPSTARPPIEAAAAAGHPRGADRRQRRPAPLRLRPRRRRPPRRPGPRAGLDVRGVMGYEGHLMVRRGPRRAARRRSRRAMDVAARGPRPTSAATSSRPAAPAPTTSTTGVTEIQAGSYALMDTAYAKLGLPFRQALHVLATVDLGRRPSWAVADVGPEGLGMDHGNPTIDGATVWFCSDEHVTFDPGGIGPVRPSATASACCPAHVDPTMALHERPTSSTATRWSTLADRPPRLVDGRPPSRCRDRSRLTDARGSPSSGRPSSGEGPEGPAPVRDGVLLVRGHLGERAPVALVRHEDRVVAEAACAARRPRR